MMNVAPALWRIEPAGSDGPPTMPLIVNVPHAGTYLPPSIAGKLAPAGIGVPDTDWHVEKLYDFVPAMGVTLMVATHSPNCVGTCPSSTDCALLHDATKHGGWVRPSLDWVVG